MTDSPARDHSPRSWLAFEAGVLRRLEFGSVAIPFTGAPDLAWYLKLWRKRVLANDSARWSWWSARALVENDAARLDDDDLERLTAPAVSGESGQLSAALSRWLAPSDALWFETLRGRAGELESSERRALAVRAGLLALDYALGFPREGMALRRPLGEALADLVAADRPAIRSGVPGSATNRDAEELVAAASADLLYVRLPAPDGVARWRYGRHGLFETWVRGGDGFWGELEERRRARLGGTFGSKHAYLAAVERFLAAAGNFPALAVSFNDDGWISPTEVIDRIAASRSIRVTYSKDFTHAAGGLRAYVVVAG